MPRYIIECEVEGASELTDDDVARIARTSRDAVDSLGVPYTWVTSYVAGNKIYCVHDAEDADTVLEHTRRWGYPASSVSMVAHEFGPHTVESVPTR